MAKRFINGQTVNADDLNEVFDMVEQTVEQSEQARLQAEQANLMASELSQAVQQAFESLPDGQAVSAQVALNTAEIELIKASYDIVDEIDDID